MSSQAFDGSVIVLPSATSLWPVTSAAAFTLSDFRQLIDLRGTFDVCLLGCGAQMAPLARDLRLALKDAGVTLDPMDTGAACRTYNVLAAEGRAVAAALIAI